MQISELQQERKKFKPVLPKIISGGAGTVKAKMGKGTKSISDQKTVQKIFSNTYGL